MEWFTILKCIHVTSFAAWFGTVLTSIFLLKTFQPKLTGEKEAVADFPQLLRTYIQLETSVADKAFKLTVASGLLMAWFYHGWDLWLGVKIGLVVLQVALTLGYIVKAIQPITYPTSNAEYARWYKLFAISLSMFALVLGITFFLL